VLEFGKTYYWRVDEVNDASADSPRKGAVWSFTTAGFIVVDDFESYVDDLEGRIFQSWIDGWGYTEPAPGAPGNGTGSAVGYTEAPFAETVTVHGGGQSMPLDYNNINSPYYSETDRTWAIAQDWTLNDVNTLSLWFQGVPAKFAQTATGLEMSVASWDIWEDTAILQSDEFRFAYKRLNGDGVIVAKVDSLINSNGWAKAGVMIRESLAAGCPQAYMVVTPSNGVAFQRRLFTEAVSASTTQTGVAAPRWLRLTRTGNTFKAEHSADGTTWTSVGADAAASSDTLTMGGSIYIGLCLTSHDRNISTTAEFSGVTLTGGVSGQWQVADVGATLPGNDAGQLYVAVEDSAGKSALVNHPDGVTAVQNSEWTEWQIPLTDLAGVNLKSVKKMTIGVGDRDNPTPDGHGKLFIDDIRVTKPVPAGQ